MSHDLTPHLNPPAAYLPHVLALLICAFGLASLACGNECGFLERCNGSVLEVCGGPDQMFGRSVTEYPCDDANPVCEEFEGGEAICTRADSEPCDRDTFVPYCDNEDVMIVCHFSLDVTHGRDCGLDGPKCLETEDGARCGIDPPTECDKETFERGCSDGGVLGCHLGWQTLRPCPNGCEQHENGPRCRPD